MDGLSAVTGRSAPAHRGVSGAADAAVLRRLELSITRRLDGILHGDHRGLVPGHGSEPGEARVYEPGDDVRRIDWNAYGRFGTLYVKLTEAREQLPVHILVDASQSMAFGEPSKLHYASQIAAALGYVALARFDRLTITALGAVPQPMAFGEPVAARLPHRPAMLPVFVHLALVLMLGLWIPPFLAAWYRQAALLIG